MLYEIAQFVAHRVYPHIKHAIFEKLAPTVADHHIGKATGDDYQTFERSRPVAEPPKVRHFVRDVRAMQRLEAG